MISTFDLFSIGIGPSSSHTVGPMRAAFDFVQQVEGTLSAISRIDIHLYGSLADTGVGHGTVKALLLGLEGAQPDTIDPDYLKERAEAITLSKKVNLLSKRAIDFNLTQHLHFHYGKTLDYHSNGMIFYAYDIDDQILYTDTYFSVGGGFIVRGDGNRKTGIDVNPTAALFPFNTAADLIKICKDQNWSIKEVMMANEKAIAPNKDIFKETLAIAKAMQDCIHRGCKTSGVLEGPLQVRRRAPALYAQLMSENNPNSGYPLSMRWLNVYAMAVNEENANGGRVVTAPTNGAAGIIPAVLSYYKHFHNGTGEGVVEFLLTAAAIGILYKKNASISGAEMGCQGEVGVACSMAAAGLVAALGGSVLQVENAAEIGMEHNLGLTCDPVGGRVQIPCIERNAMGAVKAVNAAHLALAEDGQHKVSLDMVINTMREIGHNMNSIYKETSKGGLAVNVPEC